MGKIISIIRKNMLTLLRSRVSALVIIFGPLLLTLLVGMAFSNGSLNSIKVGVHAPEYNELVTSFVDKLVESKLTVVKVESEEACAENIRQGIVNLCLSFPAGFETAKADSEAANNQITFYVDPTQINLVYGVIDIISAQVESRKTELSSDLTTNLLMTLEGTNTKLVNLNPVFTDITASSELVKNKQQGIGTKLNSLNLDFSANRFGYKSFEKIRNDINKAMTGTNLTVRTRINTSIALVDSLRKDINESSIGGTPEANELMSDLSTLRTRLRSVDLDLKNIDENTMDDFDQALTALNNELQTTTEKFDSAKDSRDEIVNRDIKDVGTSLDLLLSKLLVVKSTSDTIRKDIDSIPVKEASGIVSPIRTSITPIVSENYLNYMFPALIGLVVMLITLLFAQTIIMMEKKSPAYFRNLVTPTKDVLFLYANFLTTFLLLLVQLTLILTVSTIIFKVSVFQNFLPTLVSLFMVVTLFTLIGIIIGIVFSTQETSTLAAISFGSICLFLSDVILPLESMPHYIQIAARFNPFVLSEYLLRHSLVFKTPLSGFVFDTYQGFGVPAAAIFLGYIILLVVLLLVLNNVINRNLLQKRGIQKKFKRIEDLSQISDMPGEVPDKINVLVDSAMHMIGQKEYHKASLIYVHLNELYTKLPKERKRDFFKKIVRIHEELEKAHKKKEKAEGKHKDKHNDKHNKKK